MFITIRHHLLIFLLMNATGLTLLTPAYSEEIVNDNQTSQHQPLDSDIQELKKEVLTINRELFMIEEDLLYPQSTQLTVFVSIDVGKFFELDSIQLRIDDKIVSNYLYTAREVTALKKGGVQRLYQGNLKSGKHELTAYFIGKGPHDRDYKRGVTKIIDKDLTPLFAEFKIADDASQQQPAFDAAIWNQ